MGLDVASVWLQGAAPHRNLPGHCADFNKNTINLEGV